MSRWNVLPGWEVVLAMSAVLILFGVQRFSAWLASRLPPSAPAPETKSRRWSLRLWIAQGFSIGRIPFAPGTFGTFLGLGWVALLLWPGNVWAYLVGTVQGALLSVWLCDDAEKILGETDPGSVVLDEVAAMPFCFLPWVVGHWMQHEVSLPLSALWNGSGLWCSLVLVALFRLFDIWKPWPVRQLQRLRGGWGVTIDDLFAAGYVAICSVPFLV
jgi:phosphatidylglycerophosphatase A